MPTSALMNVMVAAVRKAGRSLARDFGEVEQLQVSVKGPGDFVTASDHKAEKILFEELSKARSGYGFIMEERGEVEGPDKTHRWIVDPLDGTLNFMHGLPHFAISVALERTGDLVAGVIYNPATNDLFTAEKGKGAFLNDRRLRVANRRQLSDCLVACSKPSGGLTVSDQYAKDIANLSRQCAGTRNQAAAALDLAWVAAGRFDGFCHRDLSPWDIAAGILMVREAGGFVSDYEGGTTMLESGDVIAANARIHKQLVGVMR
ncbi:MAG: inositol monophosphatase family protein [Hyphomicrobiaceae bacterium]